jgi:hypothetical protein
MWAVYGGIEGSDVGSRGAKRAQKSTWRMYDFHIWWFSTVQNPNWMNLIANYTISNELQPVSSARKKLLSTGCTNSPQALSLS